MIKVAEYRSLQELVSLRGEWNELIERCEHASTFAEWEWLEAFWKHDVAGKRPVVLTARDGQGTLVGLLPLNRVARLGLIPTYEVAGSTRSGYPIGDYGGPVAAPGMTSTVWKAMLEYLQQTRWAVIDLRNCPVSAAMSEAQMRDTIMGVSSTLGWTATMRVSDACRVIPLPDTFDGYLSTLSANARQNLRRKLRKLSAAGHTLEEVPSHNKDIRNEAIDTLIALHQARWARDASGGSFPNAQHCALHKYLADRLSSRGQIDIRASRSPEGEITGVIYNLRHKQTTYFYILGVSQDPRWSHLSLGVCLLADSIRTAIEGGYSKFDLLRGTHGYKEHFGGYTANNMRVTVYRYGWLPRLYAMFASTRAKLSDMIPAQITGNATSE